MSETTDKETPTFEIDTETLTEYVVNAEDTADRVLATLEADVALATKLQENYKRAGGNARDEGSDNPEQAAWHRFFARTFARIVATGEYLNEIAGTVSELADTRDIAVARKERNKAIADRLAKYDSFMAQMAKEHFCATNLLDDSRIGTHYNRLMVTATKSALAKMLGEDTERKTAPKTPEALNDAVAQAAEQSEAAA